MRKFVYILILVAICVGLADAQGFRRSIKHDEDEYFTVDHALFKADLTSNDGRLEVYYQIFNRALNFEEFDDYFEAEYELSIKVIGDHDSDAGNYEHNQKVRVLSHQKAISRTDYRTNQVNFTLHPGKYEVITTLYDPQHNKEIERKFKVEVDKYDDKKPMISDIEMIQALSPRNDNPSVFDKGDLRLIPSVRHKYGQMEDMKLYFYMELYQGRDSLDEIRVETVLRHLTKGMLYRDSLTTVFDTPIKRQFREISIDDLRPGKYELFVTLKGRRNKKIDVKYADFEILWSAQAMLKHDYDVIVHQIALIASKEEVEQLEDKVTLEDRINAFNAFWESKDPTPGTVENETKNEFYRRVAIANENFSFTYDNGWSTDRGRIYIMYGEPDQVDDYPIVPDRRPYQEWHYYHGSTYRKFIFEDTNEDGDYRLIYPYDGLYQRPDF